jgi:hypothetical protein
MFLKELRGFAMSQLKTIMLIDEAMKAEARERCADRDALLRLLEQEIGELNEVIRRLTLRIEILEGGTE